MVQHIQDNHTIHCIEKIAKLQREMAEEKRQLHTFIKDQEQRIAKLEDRLRAIFTSMRNLVETELSEVVTTNCLQDSGRPGEVNATFIKDQEQRIVKLKDRRRAVFTSSVEMPNLVETEPSEVVTTNCLQDSGRPGELDATIKKLCEDVTTIHSQIVRIAENVQSLQEKITRHSIAIDGIRLRQDVLDVKTTNGTFTWKIPEVRRRYGDAVERRTISLYSPPFYTSPHGYHMCIRVYLNGDGVGRGTHVSVFFVLMRSEHDSLLSWPFRQSVRFTLINQVNPNASISEAFVPDLESPSFQKPDGDMNIASGFLKFAK